MFAVIWVKYENSGRENGYRLLNKFWPKLKKGN